MRYLIVLLALAGIFDSYSALRIHYQNPADAPPCAVTEKFDCGIVNHSRYAVLPPIGWDEAPNSGKFHVPVAAIGIIGYLLIAGLALSKQYWALLQVSEIGFLSAVFLSYLEAYVIQKWCIYCLWSFAILTAIFLLAIAQVLTDHLRRRRSPPIPSA